jgi:hypothetical protein
MGNIERNQRSSAKSDEAPRLLETTVAPGKQPDECVAFSEKSRIDEGESVDRRRGLVRQAHA